MKKQSLRKAAIFSVLFLAFYFLLGCIYSYYINTSEQFNVFFGADSPRILIDLIQITGGHYRTIVHPLFVILFQPIVHILNFITDKGLLSALLLQSIVSSLSIGFLYLILDKLKLDNKMKNLFTLIMGLSFAQIIFNSTLETYAFAQLFLLILFYYVLGNDNRKFNNWDVVILSFLGVMNLGITLTNYFVYLLAVAYFLLFNKKEKISKKLLYGFLIVLLSVTISIALSEVQAVFFESSSLFFKDNIYNFLFGSSEELTYIEPFTINSILNQIKSVFVFGFFAPNMYLTNDVYNLKLAFGKIYLSEKIIVAITMVLIILAIIIFIRKNYKRLLEHKYLLLLIVAFMFNFGLHMFYGNSESFLYLLHYQFLLILIMAYILQTFSNKTNKYAKIFMIFFLMVEIIFNIFGLVNMYLLCSSNYGIIKNISSLTVIIPIICIIVAILLLNINFKKKAVSLISLFLVITIMLIGYNVFIKKTFKYDEYTKVYNQYVKQLNLLKREFNVEVAYDNNAEDFYFFGMGNRKKIMYQDGALYDLENNKVIVDYEIKKEMIVPNEYTVVLKTENDEIVKIYENEESIFIETKNKKTNLDKKAEKIKLPEFKDNKYSEVLKVLHQEILFNIDESVIKPNILVYDQAWYRDGMLGAMVLDLTDNIDLIKNWVDDIEEIYDRQNGREEADNLGELLYLLYITKSDNKIYKEVIAEINKIKELNNNYISGYTDSQILAYYPTVIAKYAASKSGIDLDLTVPELDNYSSLTWFYDGEQKNANSYDSVDYPYLGWASYHTTGNGGLYICDNLYPLSYERYATYAQYNLLPDNIEYYKNISLSPTHVWDAAEKFLFLYEQN